MLKTVKVNKSLKDYKEIIKIFDEAFPDNEKFPLWFLNAMHLRKGFEFTAYYDENTLAGLTYTIKSNTYVFVLYLAVNQNVRSMGYGTQILEILKNKEPQKPLILNIEPVVKEAENYEQRVKRLKFYERNGFRESGYLIDDGQNLFSALVTSEDFNPKLYLKTIGRLMFNLHTPKLILKK